MIIFDLEGTLADCEHRRHFVDRSHPLNEEKRLSEISLESTPHPEINPYVWKRDWKSFYEACDKDTPIEPTCVTAYSFYQRNIPFQIWSGRCESVRSKTERWLDNNHIEYDKLKMRPIGDNTPDDQLKKRWLDEAIAEGKTIDFVFDDSERCCNMWRRRGIFVFNCAQHDDEF